MNRRRFLGWLGKGAAAIIALPYVAGKVEPVEAEELAVVAPESAVRGWQHYVVTHTGDKGPGSFRDALRHHSVYVTFDIDWEEEGPIKLPLETEIQGPITIEGGRFQGGGFAISPSWDPTHYSNDVYKDFKNR